MTVEEKFQSASPVQKVGIVLGSLCFICNFAFTLLHLGFTNSASHIDKPIEFLSTNQLWFINAGLGVLGGALLNFKRPIISAVCGFVASIGITGFGMLYTSWRTYIASFEIIIVLGIGVLPGVILYRILAKSFK